MSPWGIPKAIVWSPFVPFPSCTVGVAPAPNPLAVTPEILVPLGIFNEIETSPFESLVSVADALVAGVTVLAVTFVI